MKKIIICSLILICFCTGCDNQAIWKKEITENEILKVYCTNTNYNGGGWNSLPLDLPVGEFNTGYILTDYRNGYFTVESPLKTKIWQYSNLYRYDISLLDQKEIN